MLARPEGPIIEDYPHDPEDIETASTTLACPVNFNPRPESLTDLEKLLHTLQAEIATMKTWYDIGCQRAGRSTTGVSGLTPEETAGLFADFVNNKIIKTETDGPRLSDLLRMAAEDLKAFYFEAVSAQPGQPTNAQALADWFWGETIAASFINEVRKTCLKQDSKDMLLNGKLLLVPRTQMHRFNN